MRKSKLSFLFSIILISSIFVSCVASADNNVETQKNTKTQSIKANPFFWGTWVRMDNGQEYEVLETFIVQNDDCYAIEYSDNDTLTIKNFGTFKKESESVIVCNNVPYFRNGGVNLEYSLKLVGFTSSSSTLSVRAVGTNLSGIKGKGKSIKYEDFESNAESDSDGNIKLIAPTANDPQTVTITNGDDIIVVPGLSITNAGDDMGTIALVGKNDYNLKITGTILKKDNEYLYGNNNNYDMDITITNISNNKCTSSICSIETDDPNLIISSKDGTFLDAFTISTLPEGATKTIRISLQYGKMVEPFVKTGISVTINNPSTGQEWKDYIPLKFFKGLIPITVAGKSTERNDEAALNGFIIYPDGNNQFFSVRNNSYKILYVPSFGNDKKYMMVFSGATVTSVLSDSTEMHYTVSPGTTKVKDIDLFSGNKLKESMLFGGNNHSEENAYNTTEAFQAYLSEGEIDYYSILADGNEYYTPGSKKLYFINYKTAYGEAPSGFYAVEGSILKEKDLPELKQTGMIFNGWYVDGKLVKSGTDVNSFVSDDSVSLTAEWIPIQYSINYNLGEGTNNPDNPQYFTIESSTITLKEPSLFAHTFEGWYTSSDFEGNAVTEIATGTHENITLWAKWTEIRNQATVKVSAPNYSDISNLSAPVVNENIITFTAPEEYVEYAWYVDGSNELYGTSKSLSIDILTTTLKGGYHQIRLEVKDVFGVYYSAQYEFSFQK